jgi:transcriptional regulator of acetoin/glycerol metabolism
MYIRQSMPGDTIAPSPNVDAQPSNGPSPMPGLLLVFSCGKPAAVPIRLHDGYVELGREHPAFADFPDPCLSRRHVAIRFDGQRFYATDLTSRNGTSVDGEHIRSGMPRVVTRLVRVGDSLLLILPDIEPFERFGVRVAGDRVEGPALQEVLRAVIQVARYGSTLHITGESGAGKEGLARAFHAGGVGAARSFVAVNCATIPEGIAERLLFGAKRGTYSGADADADGYVQTAHGGTLFLDEVAELSLGVQAKLLRVLETGEVLQLGASKPQMVNLRFCSATHRDLRAHVAIGKLRADLYYRMAIPRVAVLPLRERPEEIPWLLTAEIAKIAPDLLPHVSLVETCLLRPWPGNVREFLVEIRTAAQSAVSMGSKPVDARHLHSTAGSAFAVTPKDEHPSSTAITSPYQGEPSRAAPTPPPSRSRITRALKQSGGNISACARELGVHRTQLKRWMERYGIHARTFVLANRLTNLDDDE